MEFLILHKIVFLAIQSSTPETVLMRLLSHHDLTDTYSVTHSDVYTLQAMTRINPANMSSGSCIDYILASPELALRVTHSQVVSVTGLVTDHGCCSHHSQLECLLSVCDGQYYVSLPRLRVFGISRS